MPLKWSTEILCKAQQDGFIKNPPGYKALIGQVADFRAGLTGVAAYGHIPVPLVYTQVVTLAVYFYFGVSLIGEQWLLTDDVDLYYPIFMTIKFLFLFGWLRVADTLYNPFGEDDDDFELNELLNRHFRVAMHMVSEMAPAPPLKKDLYFDQVEPELADFPAWTEDYATTMSQMERDYDIPEGRDTDETVFTTNQEQRY